MSVPGTESTFDHAYLKPSTIAARLDLHRSQVYKLIKDGTLPHIRIGKSVRVPAASLEAYLRRLEQHTPEPLARDLKRESIRVEVESRLAGFIERTGKDPAEFIADWQAHTIPDTAENAELAMDALALRNVMEDSFAAV
jgi:excisionase family DNA binding protein